MALHHILGTDQPWLVSQIYQHGDAETCEVSVKGEVEDLEAIDDFGDYLPTGYEYLRSTVIPDGDGMGTLKISCVLPGAADISTLPDSVTYQVKMAPVEYDLVNHTHFDSEHGFVRAVIAKWLATPEGKRYADGTYRYDENGDGSMTEINSGTAEYDFCRAYDAGIRTYTRYYPVIVKVSTYKRLPGASMVGRSTVGGTVQFSAGIGFYNDPDLLLQNYGAGHWWKSDDAYQQNQDQSWTRTEEWTYTPDTEDSPNGWIYAELD